MASVCFSGSPITLTIDPERGVAWAWRVGGGSGSKRCRCIPRPSSSSSSFPPPPRADEGLAPWSRVVSVRHVPPASQSPSSSSSSAAARDEAKGGGDEEEGLATPLKRAARGGGVGPGNYEGNDDGDGDWLSPAPCFWPEPRHPHLHTVVVYFAEEEVRGGGRGGGGLGAWWRRRRWRPRQRVGTGDDDVPPPDETRLRLRALVARTPDADAAAAAARVAEQALASASPRPRRLLVFVNPHSGRGGRRAAERAWREAAAPALCAAAGVSCDALRTRARGEAARRCAEACFGGAGYDGALAVGGDGLFQELLQGVLLPPPPPCAGGGMASAAAAAAAASPAAAPFRIGHVPAGSTDAAAYTLHGSRDACTAALACALGLGGRLDVAEMRRLSEAPPPLPPPPVADDAAAAAAAAAATATFPAPPSASPSPPLLFCCMASSGFLGDVLSASERLRFLGPLRYDAAGVLALLRLKAAPARIEYVPPPSSSSSSSPCASPSPCGGGDGGREVWVPLALPGASGGRGGGGGGEREERRRAAPALPLSLCSIKIAVTACRSDRSRRGVAPGLGADDGRLLLAAVGGSSRARYLRFLLRLAREGLSVSAATVVAAAAASAAGEDEAGTRRRRPRTPLLSRLQFLLPAPPVSAVVHASAVRVFWDRCWNVDGELVSGEEGEETEGGGDEGGGRAGRRRSGGGGKDGGGARGGGGVELRVRRAAVAVWAAAPGGAATRST